MVGLQIFGITLSFLMIVALFAFLVASGILPLVVGLLIPIAILIIIVRMLNKVYAS